MPFVGRDSNSCLLFQQLEYWFDKPQYAGGFYKFLEPATNEPQYKEGQSWTEELGVSDKVFRTAFARIGTHWGSKKEYENAEDKFQGKYFCSYYDRQRHLTYYFRNNDLVNALLDSLVLGEPQREVTENPNRVSAISETTTENSLYDEQKKLDHLRSFIKGVLALKLSVLADTCSYDNDEVDDPEDTEVSAESADDFNFLSTPVTLSEMYMRDHL